MDKRKIGLIDKTTKKENPTFYERVREEKQLTKQSLPIIPLYAMIFLLAIGGLFYVFMDGNIPGLGGDSPTDKITNNATQGVPSSVLSNYDFRRVKSRRAVLDLQAAENH